MANRRQAQSQKSRPSDAPYVVSLTESVRAAYHRLKAQARAPETAGSAVVALAKVDQLIRELLPHDPVNARYALYDPLSDLHRASADSWSVGWVVLKESRHVVVIHLHTDCKFRKEAVPEIIARLHKGGYLNKLIQQTQALVTPDDATRH